MSVLNKPKIEAYIGGTGSGKGVSINRRLAELKPRRLIIWDPRKEYSKHAPAYDSPAALARALRAAKGGPFKGRLCFGPSRPIEQDFGMLCEIAMAAGDLVFVAEELSDVTKPSWAPPAWRQCITQGRHQGLHLIGATQRPALIDKTFLSASTQLRCFMLGYSADWRTMAEQLCTTEDEVKALVTTEDEATGKTTIQYLERIRRTRELFAGTITINGSRFTDKRALCAGEATPRPTKRGRAT